MCNKYNTKINKKLKQMTEQKKEIEAELQGGLKLAVWIISLLALLKLLAVAL